MRQIVGLTGSIGMGKSTVAAMIARAGVPLFDADAVVRRLTGPDGALVAAVEQLHSGTTGPRGIDRAAVARAVFGDRPALARLEALIHPAVAAERRRFLRRHRAAPLVVLDIPLLFERDDGLLRRLDAVLVVSAAPWQQRARVLARPGMTPARLAGIRAVQLADPFKRAKADWVIPTGGTVDRTRAAVRHILACLAAARRR